MPSSHPSTLSSRGLTAGSIHTNFDSDTAVKPRYDNFDRL
ncbi:MAG: palindromic element RPE4 domain-containing protein [Gammaproteobacteria bacterium]|nr:palindromic element RPE4 domain-containing protein [Gammaproteobacteria bacterium]NNM14218.1 palindromic element RPE4 domain-containing protein [Gammaproteobacteria bacterium]